MTQKTAMSKLYSYIQVAHDLGAKQVDSLTLLRLIYEFQELEKNQIIKAFDDKYDESQGFNMTGEKYYKKTYTK